MRSVDGQMFNGYRQYIGLTDLKIQNLIEHLASVVAEYLAAPTESCIILGGAGTSGRLAMFCSRAFNKLMEASVVNVVHQFDVVPRLLGNHELLCEQIEDRGPPPPCS